MPAPPVPSAFRRGTSGSRPRGGGACTRGSSCTRGITRHSKMIYRTTWRSLNWRKGLGSLPTSWESRMTTSDPGLSVEVTWDDVTEEITPAQVPPLPLDPTNHKEPRHGPGLRKERQNSLYHPQPARGDERHGPGDVPGPFRGVDRRPGRPRRLVRNNHGRRGTGLHRRGRT